MLELFSALLGFAAPFLPECVKYFQRKQDNAHELDMLRLQIEKGSQEHLWRADEIRLEGEMKADEAETKVIYNQPSSFGVQMLDAAKGQNLSPWILYPAFMLYVLVDAMSAAVRPGITYAAFGFYMAVKWAELSIARANASGLSAALLNVWGQEDRAIVILVLSYWFGHRASKAAFGGSAMTSKAGA